MFIFIIPVCFAVQFQFWFGVWFFSFGVREGCYIGIFFDTKLKKEKLLICLLFLRHEESCSTASQNLSVKRRATDHAWIFLRAKLATMVFRQRTEFN